MELSILAHDVCLTGSRGPVYADVTLATRPGEIVAITGAAGSGRTALLLTLAGRMTPDEGRLALLGHQVVPKRIGRALRQVFRRSALVNVVGITDFDEALTVAEIIGERAALLSRIFEPIGPIDEHFIADLWQAGEPPQASAYLWQLTDADRVYLQLCLALLADPELVAVDDLDSSVDPAGRARLVARLNAVAESGVTVVVVAHDVPAELDVNHVVVL